LCESLLLQGEAVISCQDQVDRAKGPFSLEVLSFLKEEQSIKVGWALSSAQFFKDAVT